MLYDALSISIMQRDCNASASLPNTQDPQDNQRGTRPPTSMPLHQRRSSAQHTSQRISRHFLPSPRSTMQPPCDVPARTIYLVTSPPEIGRTYTILEPGAFDEYVLWDLRQQPGWTVRRFAPGDPEAQDMLVRDKKGRIKDMKGELWLDWNRSSWKNKKSMNVGKKPESVKDTDEKSNPKWGQRFSTRLGYIGFAPLHTRAGSVDFPAKNQKDRRTRSLPWKSNRCHIRNRTEGLVSGNEVKIESLNKHETRSRNVQASTPNNSNWGIWKAIEFGTKSKQGTLIDQNDNIFERTEHPGRNIAFNTDDNKVYLDRRLPQGNSTSLRRAEERQSKSFGPETQPESEEGSQKTVWPLREPSRQEEGRIVRDGGQIGWGDRAGRKDSKDVSSWEDVALPEWPAEVEYLEESGRSGRDDGTGG